MRRPMLALALGMGLIAGGAARAQDDPTAEFHATTLSVSADGQVRVAPDLATVQIGVRDEAPTAAGALARNRQQMNAVTSALKAQSVADRDVQTSNLSLEAQYFDDGKAPRRLTGYQAANTVAIRLHDLARIGAVVDALVAAGANQVDSIGFGLDDPTSAEDAARRAAVKALQAKADLYAQATGYRIQRLVRLSENSPQIASPPFALPMAPMMAMRRVSTPVAPGELTVQVSVSAVYELAH